MSKARLYFDIFHHTVRDRDSQSIPLRRDIHKHPMSRSILQTRTHPLRLGYPSNDLFVSMESHRGVCKNVLFAYLRDDSIPFICTVVRRRSCRVSIFFRQTEKNTRECWKNCENTEIKRELLFLSIDFTLIIFITIEMQD